MSKKCYVPRNFDKGSLEIIAQANKIVDEYRAQGYDLTLRQLYYQFVSRDLLANQQRNYKRLGSIINDARLAGMVDWDAIEDRTRGLEALPHWDAPSDIIEACANQFRFDKWSNQPYRIELWVEKEALAGVFAGICQELDIPYLCCRGYTSQSEMYRAAMRLKRFHGQETLILHFGDHDPSGIDMTRDIQDRLRIFGCQVEVKRIALNMNQVEEHEPPPNPAKTTDSRFESYMREYGEESWELDALEPKLLTSMVRDEVYSVRDVDLWKEKVEEEDEAKKAIGLVSEKWDRVVDFVNEEG